MLDAKYWAIFIVLSSKLLKITFELLVTEIFIVITNESKNFGNGFNCVHGSLLLVFSTCRYF